MKIKKSTISLIVLALISIILITGFLFQMANDLVKSNGHLYIKNIGQEVYAQDDGGGDGDGGDDGGGDGDGGDDGGGDGDGGDDGGGDGDGGDSDDSGDSDESSYASEESEESEDYESDENMDGSYAYEGENEATETEEERQFEEAEFKAEEEDDEATNKALDEENDGWYGGPKDSEGNLLDREDWPVDAEYDNEDETGQLKVDEKGFREYLKDRDIDLDTDYYKYSPDEKKKMEEEYEEQKEDKYRDITTAGEDVEGFERFVEEKRGDGYDFDDNYHWETPEEQRKLEKEFNEMKLKRAAEDLKPSEQIPIKGGPTIIEPKDDNRRISGNDVADFKEFLIKEKGIKYDEKYDSIRGDEQLKLEDEFKNSKYYKQDKKDKNDKSVIVKKYYDDDDDDDDNDNDIDDYASYQIGYRNGKFDRLSKTSYTDISPFDEDAKTWYKIGYRAGWDSVITESVSESKIQIK